MMSLMIPCISCVFFPETGVVTTASTTGAVPGTTTTLISEEGKPE